MAVGPVAEFNGTVQQVNIYMRNPKEEDDGLAEGSSFSRDDASDLNAYARTASSADELEVSETSYINRGIWLRPLAGSYGGAEKGYTFQDVYKRQIQVLSRRTKNNPVLIGEPGVGKTAIVEGIAQRIVAGDVPSTLRDRDPVSYTHLWRRHSCRGSPCMLNRARALRSWVLRAAANRQSPSSSPAFINLGRARSCSMERHSRRFRVPCARDQLRWSTKMSRSSQVP